MLLNYARLASGWYPILLVFYRRPRYDLQTRKICYSASQRDVEPELLNTACSDVETKTVFQDIYVEQLSRGSNKSQDARWDIQARGFWEHQRSAFSDVRVCHPNA